MARIIGWIFIVLALAVVAWEAMGFFEFGEWRLIVFGEIAFRLFPETLNLAQAITQRYIADWAWDPLIQTILLWPAWPILGGIGLLFLLLGSRRR